MALPTGGTRHRGRTLDELQHVEVRARSVSSLSQGPGAAQVGGVDGVRLAVCTAANVEHVGAKGRHAVARLPRGV